MSSPRIWPFGAPDPGADLNLFCFAHAGGGASSYRAWTRVIDEVRASRRGGAPRVKVVPVQLPGRETRIAEAPVGDWPPLLSPLAEQLRDCATPIALFGHSFGALVAARLDAELARVGRRPDHLFVSGSRAPSAPRLADDWHRLDDEAFVGRVRELGGFPDLVLQTPELLELVLPPLRADFRLAATVGSFQPTETPLSAFYGRADPWTPRHFVEAWGELTSSEFVVDVFDGDHFFVYQQASSVLERILELV